MAGQYLWPKDRRKAVMDCDNSWAYGTLVILEADSND